MPPVQSTHQRILATIIGVAHELRLDVTHDEVAPREGDLHFFRAGSFDAAARLSYVFRIGSMSDLTFSALGGTSNTGTGVTFDAAEAQRVVDAVAAALMTVVGADPLIHVGPPRPPRNRGVA